MNETKAESSKCPECGSSKALPILYGMPSAEAGKAAQEGKIILGGCSIEIGAPTWHCDQCGHEWGEFRIGD
jgi:predicted RNA-binding Zn-ribbon protein involved in translation (DUF1610 family)